MSDKTKASNGSGSVFPAKTKNGKTVWKAQVTLGRKSNGKTRRTTRTAATRREAEKLLRQMLHQQDDGRLTQINNTTVAALGRIWAREERPQRVRASTAAGYEDILRRYINPTLGNIRVIDLRPADIEKMMTVLKADNKSASTVNAARRIMFGLCTYAVRMGYITYNPVSATRTVKRQVHEPTQVKPPWTQEEAAQALQASRENDAMDCFIHIMLYTGLRPGEALGLRWCDIDMARNIFHITGTLKEERRLTPDGTGVVRLKRNDPKTLHSRRTLSIHPDLKPVLERQQMRHDTWKLISGDQWQNTGYLITTHVGTAVNPSNHRKLFYQFLKQSKIRRIRPHDLRHVVARLALEADLRIEDISQAFGHTRIDTTKQIYAGHVQKLNDRFTQSIGDLYDDAKRSSMSENLPDYRNQ